MPWIIISKVAKEAQQQQKAPHLKASKYSSSGRSSQENAENLKNYAARSTIELQMTMIQIKFLKNLVEEEEEKEEDTYTSNNRNQIDKKKGKHCLSESSASSFLKTGIYLEIQKIQRYKKQKLKQKLKKKEN